MKLEQTDSFNKTHSASVIIFHGSGDTGLNIKAWIRFLLGVDLAFPHIKIIYPTAPLQPYTLLKGKESHVWFDRKSMTIEARDCRKTLSAIYSTVHEYLNNEVINYGIPIDRILVGGFSMGGALAMHTGYHLNRNVAGVFVCSSFLSHTSIVYDSLTHNRTHGSKLPDLLMFQGDSDHLIEPSWAAATFNELQKFDVPGKFITLPNVDHELSVKELLDLKTWIEEKLPPLDTDIVNKA